jgi:hypothetical protein
LSVAVTNPQHHQQRTAPDPAHERLDVDAQRPGAIAERLAQRDVQVPETKSLSVAPPNSRRANERALILPGSESVRSGQNKSRTEAVAACRLDRVCFGNILPRPSDGLN